MPDTNKIAINATPNSKTCYRSTSPFRTVPQTMLPEAALLPSYVQCPLSAIITLR
jgi:hypothetical protein